MENSSNKEFIMKKILLLGMLAFCSILSAQDYPNSFTPVWQDLSWGNGGLTPTGVIWSMDGIFDFDNDGLGEFFLSSSWSGNFGNDAILYEAAGDNQYQIVWYYWMNQLDRSIYNYSSITSGDLDSDGVPELIILNDCGAGQDGLLIFELNPATGTFPTQPTATWNLGIGGGIDEAADIAVYNLDDDAFPELILSFYSLNPAAAHLMVVELAEGTDLANPSWHVEMDDNTTLAYYTYLAMGTDLDQDGYGEIVAVEWNYNRFIIFENTGEDTYQKVTDLYTTFEGQAFCNEGAVEADFDGNGLNELYLVSNAGYFWVITNSGDVAGMSYDNNFTLLRNYRDSGISPFYLKTGNADSPIGQSPDGPDLYMAVYDTVHEASALLDWEYNGGPVTALSSYQIETLFAFAPPADNQFKVSKLAIGDGDGDAQQDIVMGSYSLSLTQSHLLVAESNSVTGLEPAPPVAGEGSFELAQNYPNPFNPRTEIAVDVFRGEEMTLEIYNVLGQRVRTLHRGFLPAGRHTFVWEGMDESGRSAPSGIYVYQLTSATRLQSHKMILMQ